MPLLRRFAVFIAYALSSAPQIFAATFPLEIPTRPTTFPLQRPALVGEVVAWGTNIYAEIEMPTDLTNVVAISAGPALSLALRADGAVAAWGDNEFGQCNVPTNLVDVVAISAGGFPLALKSNGHVIT